MWRFLSALLILTLIPDPVTPDPVTSGSNCVSVITIHAGKNLFKSKEDYSVDVSLWYDMVKLEETKSVRSPNPEWNMVITLKEKVPSAMLHVRMVSKNKISCDTCSIVAGGERCSFCKCKNNAISSRHVLYSYECKTKE